MSYNVLVIIELTHTSVGACQVFCMPVQLGLLDDIVIVEPSPEIPSAAKIDLKMLGCYQMRPGYEAMDFIITGESLEFGCFQGHVNNGQSKMRCKALAQPPVVFEFDFQKGS